MNQFLGMSLAELEASLEPNPSEEDTIKLTNDELQAIMDRATVNQDSPTEEDENLPIG